MKLQLDHFFILTANPKQTGDLLVELGLEESFSRDHPGQGTSNRRFVFANGMLELLYVRDAEEAQNGPAKGLRFTERLQDDDTSPFGVILTRLESSDLGEPFPGWKYQPEFFEPPRAFHVGNNSCDLSEPLCIYAPFIKPSPQSQEKGALRRIRRVEMSSSKRGQSETLQSLAGTQRLEIKPGSEHLVELMLDEGSANESRDFRPHLPLIIYW